MCQSLAHVPQERPNIFVFDTDNKDIVRKAGASGSYYKDWGNNVYSVLLPFPPFRSGLERVSIELLYKDEDLTRSSSDNRRLFLSSEFHERSGNHKKIPSIHVGNAQRIRGLTKRSTMTVIDSEIGVYDSDNNNLALSKADFADLIYSQTGAFANADFRGFRQLLLIIKGITGRANAKSVEILTRETGQETIRDIEINRVIDQRRDHPPYIPVFVGRETQIRQLDNAGLRVATITGLGGEGKSSLGSRFFGLAQDRKTRVQFEKYGWCDCKELETTFHERLIVLLEEISEGRETRQKYSDENIGDTILRFIGHLHRQECLVVFDNLDAFVDKDSFSFIDGVRFLFDQITEKLSRSMVIFTCRAPIHDFHPSFLEIPIVGLSFTECGELAAHLNIEISEQLLRAIYDSTKGHALWLNLIFGQIRSGRISPDRIQNVISTSSQITADLDVRLLRSIWDTLNQKEKEIIWVISTFARPKPVEYIERASGISYKKCVKMLRNLVALRLATEIDSEGTTLFDLHPIIRAKAKEECGRARLRSLTARVITILIPSGIPNLTILIRSNDFSKSSVENYIESVEIAVDAGDFTTAIKYLKELSDNLWRVGEEMKFVDLCKRLLQAIEGSQYRIGIDDNLSQVFESFIHILLTQGEYELADRYLIRLQGSIESIKQFIFYVEIRGYFLWFTNDFRKAVALMRDGIDEIREKKEQVPAHLRYNLALALRDSGKVDEAITIFLQGRDLSVVENWDVDSADASATDLGNLGRCFFLKGELNRALQLVERSLAILERGDSRNDKVNQGYALLWLADIYSRREAFQDAFQHLSRAIAVWKEHAPARLKKVRDHILDYPRKFMRKYGDEKIIKELPN
jgi:tetratricopeptide (TPR) repeat protein